MPLGAALEDAHTQIILQIRLPRVLLAFLVGASLGIAGAAFQGLLRNPLADPFTIGVSSGSALGAVTVIFFQLSFIGIWTLPVVAILSGFVTLCLVLSFTRLVQRSLATETIILTGIIASSFFRCLLIINGGTFPRRASPHYSLAHGQCRYAWLVLRVFNFTFF